MENALLWAINHRFRLHHELLQEYSSPRHGKDWQSLLPASRRNSLTAPSAHAIR